MQAFLLFCHGTFSGINVIVNPQHLQSIEKNPYCLPFYSIKNYTFARQIGIWSMEDKTYFKQFDINISSLKIGKHNFDMQVDKTFFEKHVNEDIIDADILIKLIVTCEGNVIDMDFDMQGYMVSTCDICLEEMQIPVSKHENLVLKKVDQPRISDDEDIVYITEHDYKFNVEQYIYEYLMVTIPIRKEHSNKNDNDRCNPLMLELIQKNQEQSQEPHYDSRWDALKKLKLEE